MRNWTKSDKYATDYAAWIPKRTQNTADKLSDMITEMLSDGELTYEEAEKILDIYNDHNWSVNAALKMALAEYGYSVDVSPSVATFTKHKKRLFKLPKRQFVLGKQTVFVIILLPTIIFCLARLLGAI